MDLNSIAESLKITGHVNLVKTNSFGEIVEERSVPNLVVTTGKYFIASKIAATTNSPASMTHMGIGTGTASATVSDTGLTQTGRVALTSQSVLNNTVTFTATFPAGTGDGAITEAGIFNASTNGTMLCRTVFPTVNKGSGDQITITWVITVS